MAGKRVKFLSNLSLHQGMDIPASPPSGKLLLAEPGAKIENWTVGRLLSALVSRANGDGSYNLQLADRQVRVNSEVPLQTGTHLRLEVVETGPRTVLKQLATPASTPPQVAILSLREALPRQGSAAPLLSNLQHIASGTPDDLPPLPREVTQLAHSIIQALTSKEALSRPGALKQALKDSGLFLEARLAAMPGRHTEVSLAQDFKAGLLKLARLLGQHFSHTDGRSTRPAPRAPASGHRRTT